MMAVNATTWKKLPIAARETEFDADDAIVRLMDWAGGDVKKFASAFLWRNDQGPANNKNSYRLPVGDIFDGKLTMVPSAVFSAAKIMSGAHGGLEGVVGDEDRVAIKRVLTEIYDQLREMYGDPRVDAPWLKGRTEQERAAELKAMGISNSKEEAVSASAYGPVFPPKEWFDDPRLTQPTPLTISADGRVFGHVATWDTCHVASARYRRRCVTPPHSASNYKYFKTGQVLTEDGTMLRVGRLTAGTGHPAIEGVTAARASAHYDNTGWSVAAVNAGEDSVGIWVAGAITANADPAKVQELRLSPLSGDWRPINGRSEMVAALAVNDPGFPVYALTASAEFDDEGELMVLTAANPVFHEEGVLDRADEQLQVELQARQERLASIRERMKVAEDVRRARRFEELKRSL